MEEAPAGTVCAVTGLTRTRPGEGLGCEAGRTAPVLEPVLTYQVLLPEGTRPPHCPAASCGSWRRRIPSSTSSGMSSLREIHVQLMGEVQLEILRRLHPERFGLEVGLRRREHRLPGDHRRAGGGHRPL